MKSKQEEIIEAVLAIPIEKWENYSTYVRGVKISLEYKGGCADIFAVFSEEDSIRAEIHSPRLNSLYNKLWDKYSPIRKEKEMEVEIEKQKILEILHSHLLKN